MTMHAMHALYACMHGAYAPSLTSKFKILNVFWTWSVSNWMTHQIDFFNRLLNLKNLVSSNGFKNVRYVIQTALK